MSSFLGGIVPVKYRPLAQALVVSNLVSLLLFAVRILGADNFRFGFLFWNLLLAAVPMLLALLLLRGLKKRRWLSWRNLVLSAAWLAFLPNSFYILTDFIHVHLTGEINILFDVVLFFSCVFNGFVFGFWSLYLVHRELLKRLSRDRAHAVIGGILFVSSFAIYLGRYMRWNSWDILVHPFGIFFDVTSRLANPAAYPQSINTTLTFFILLSGMYWVIYEFISLSRGKRR